MKTSNNIDGLLNQQSDNLRIILRCIPDIFYIIDRNYDLIFANASVEKLSGLSQNELLGKNIWKIFDDASLSLPKEKFEKAFYENCNSVFEMNYHGKLFVVNLYPMELGLVVSGSDVTESRKAGIDRSISDDALIKSMKEIADYKFALDESSIVAITDEKGIVKHVNENFCTISKYSREELIGEDQKIINSLYHSEEYIEKIWMTISSGRIWKGDLKNKAKDETFYWVDTTIVPFLDESKNPYQFLAICADISERKKLEEQQSLFVSLVSSSEDAIISKDLNGLITSWNLGAEKLFGYTSSEAIGKNVIKLIPPGRLSEESIIIEKIKEGKSLQHYETERVKKDGSIVDISLTVSPIKDSRGVVIGASKIARDITVRKKNENEIIRLNEELEERVAQRTAELEELNRELESFSYSVSHDLRSPLRAINGYSYRVQKSLEGKLSEEERVNFDNIISNTGRMGQLIDDLLSFSRLGRTEIIKLPFSMPDLIDQILKEHHIQNPKLNIKMNVTHSAPSDLNMMKQVWVNLIDNAVKYSSKNENILIVISSAEEKGIVTYHINDNGVGFDMEYSNKLFGVFQRLHSIDEFEGVGVGLAIVKKIISKHKGTVWAKSEVNKGADFYFTLPLN